MRKNMTSRATVDDFLKAVYPKMTELAVAANGEEEILRDATETIVGFRTALLGLIDEPQPLGIDRPTYQAALAAIKKAEGGTSWTD